MSKEETDSPEPRRTTFRRIGAPLSATARTLWLLLSSLTRLTVRWLSHAPATTVVTVALTLKIGRAHV